MANSRLIEGLSSVDLLLDVERGDAEGTFCQNQLLHTQVTPFHILAMKQFLVDGIIEMLVEVLIAPCF